MTPTAKIKCPRCGEDVCFDQRDILWKGNKPYYATICDCGECVTLSNKSFEENRVDG